jgi:hypothetical protein
MYWESKPGRKLSNQGSEIVPDTNFGTDPGPRIRTTDLRIRIWIWIQILLFSSATFKMPTKNNCFFKFFSFLLFEDTFTSFFKDSQISGNQGFSNYFCLTMEGSGLRTAVLLTNGYGSGRSKTYGSYLSGSGTLGLSYIFCRIRICTNNNGSGSRNTGGKVTKNGAKRIAKERVTKKDKEQNMENKRRKRLIANTEGTEKKDQSISGVKGQEKIQNKIVLILYSYTNNLCLIFAHI